MSAEPKIKDVVALPPGRQPDPQANDLESQADRDGHDTKDTASAFKALGWLDRFLAVWIFLAMVVGILLGNFVPSTGPALQKGKFVGVSVPIGRFLTASSSKIRSQAWHKIIHVTES